MSCGVVWVRSCVCVCVCGGRRLCVWWGAVGALLCVCVCLCVFLVCGGGCVNVLPKGTLQATNAMFSSLGGTKHHHHLLVLFAISY